MDHTSGSNNTDETVAAAPTQVSSNRLKALKQILKNEAKVPSYVTRLNKLVDVFGFERILGEYEFESEIIGIEAQSLLISRVLEYVRYCEDAQLMLNLIHFLTYWTGAKNKSLLHYDRQLLINAKDQSETTWNTVRARLLIELSTLDQRFPSNLNLKKISHHILALGTEVLKTSETTLPAHSREELARLMDLHKERLRVETSDLARELRDQPKDQDSLLMQLESISLQLSQTQSLQLQLMRFYKKLQHNFIQICQQIAHSYEQRQSQLANDNQNDDENDIEALEQQEDEEKELLLSVAHILETLIAPAEYLIKMKNASSGQEQVSIYCDKVYSKMLARKAKKIYKAFAFGINVLITRSHSYKLQVSCLRLLKRFYEIFDSKHQNLLEDTIITCLQNFTEFEDVKKHKLAALFYYHLLHSFEVSDAFKTKLRDAKELELLKFNPHFSSIFYSHLIEQDSPVSLNYLHLVSGFQLEHTVQPKLNFKQYFSSTKHGSILHYNFTTQEYNIGFSVEKVGQLKYMSGSWEELNNEEVVRYSICDSHLKPISGSVILDKPGVYKIVWHNAYSYLKAKVLKYRIRILERKDAAEEQSSNDSTAQATIEDLFTVNELTEKEDAVYKAFKQIYPDFIPITKISRATTQRKLTVDQTQAESLVLLIEENRSYLKVLSNHKLKTQQSDDPLSSDTFVQQLNQKELDSAEYDASKFYTSESSISEIYIITSFNQSPHSAPSALDLANSHFAAKNKKHLRDYVIQAEKVLYYTLEKTNFKSKLHLNTEFYFADSCDTLICANLHKLVMNNTNKRAASIYNLGERDIVLLADKDKDIFQIRELTNLGFYSKKDNQSSTIASTNNLNTSQLLDQSTNEINYQMQKEFLLMVFSYLKVAFNVGLTEIEVYDGEFGAELEEMEDRVHTLKEEALRTAPILKQIFSLFRKGLTSNK